ncbi:MAG: DUF1553 domain-containing protein [Lentisphaeraceae bacterium]|nr:DUF1553 domain-containing protein [Lentisphaeraceae bacterium]
MSDKCFHCHGPDEHDRKGHLRLDVPHGEDGAFRERKGSFAIKAMDPSKSEIWNRIITDDEDDVMPPTDSTKKPLTKKEKELVKQWIEQGAEWQGHWSFNSIQKPSLPKVPNKFWAKTEIDHFVLKQLEENKLAPTEEAPRHKLIRRAYLDLIGLNPTPAEVRAFESDKSPNAYEKVIDRLLADKRYGERMAMKWLDLARYGDTSVYHADGPRTMWPWRNWVIDAYNNNKPFDEFSIEQLAGDHIPNATTSQKMATAFLRNNGTTDEGGAFDEEYRVEYTVDRLAMTSAVWLGLTMECAQCHDHKYDPISQKEFFQKYAFFNVSADKGMQTRKGNAEPKMLVPPSAEDKQEIKAYEALIAKHNIEINDHKKANLSKAKSWIDEHLKKHGHASTVEGLVHHFPLDETNGKEIADSINPKAVLKVQGRLRKSARGKDKEPAVKLEGNDNYFSKTVGEKIDNTSHFSYGGWVKLDDVNGFKAILARMDSNNGYRGFDLFTSKGKFGIHLINKWPANALKVESKAKLKNKTWHHVYATYDGTNKPSGVKLYLDGKEVEFDVKMDTLTETAITKTPFRIGRREVGANFSGYLDDIRIYNRVLAKTDIELIMKQDSASVMFSKAAHGSSAIDRDYLTNYYFTKYDKAYAGIQKKVDGLNANIESITKRDLMIMADQKVPRKTYVLNRGSYDQPMKNREVHMNTPAILPPMTEEMPKNRLGLAKWIMSDENPLTARVTVNRYWSMLFGKGLVTTPADFGSQGTWPSHVGLLDYMAADFRESGWNVKRMLKKIMMSATYRQDSVVTRELYSKDARNTLLARGPRFRLEGEFIRDNALFVSGLLNPKIGGASTKPYQPDGLWQEVSLGGKLKFKRDSGDKLYRRSMYIYWKRSSPHPGMTTFDATTREKCTVERSRTNTPLQALVTLNDEQFVEASRFFAERIIREGGNSIGEKVDWGFSQVTAHKPDSKVRQKLEAFYKDQLKFFSANPQNAQEFLSIGEKKRDDSLNLAEHAAWAVVAKLMLNMDETITKE